MTTVAELVEYLQEAGTGFKLRDGAIRDEYGYCPIISAFRHRSEAAQRGICAGNWYYISAGEMLGFSRDTTVQIVLAADDSPICDLIVREQLRKLVKR